MFQPIPVFEENVFAFKVTGKLTKKDYDEFLPVLTTLIHKYGPISLLLELEDFHGLEPEAVWEDYKFGTAHDKDFLKIAIVGDKRWERWMTVLMDAFTKTEIRFYRREDAAIAWDWLRDIEEKDEATSEKEKNSIKPYKEILVATDFSPHSEKALFRAKEIAAKYNANISILHVMEPLGSYEHDYMMVGVPEQYDHTDRILYTNAEKRLEELKNELGLPNVSGEVLWGTPKTTILLYTEGKKIDLIVMGSHGRHGISRLIGSTTNGVINHARCEVLSVNI